MVGKDLMPDIKDIRWINEILKIVFFCGGGHAVTKLLFPVKYPLPRFGYNYACFGYFLGLVLMELCSIKINKRS